MYPWGTTTTSFRIVWAFLGDSDHPLYVRTDLVEAVEPVADGSPEWAKTDIACVSGKRYWSPLSVTEVVKKMEEAAKG